MLRSLAVRIRTVDLASSLQSLMISNQAIAEDMPLPELRVHRPLKPGIYAPVLTFFQPGSEDLDIPNFKSHIVRLGKAGVAPVVSGSTGEPLHMSNEERIALIRAAREALDQAGMSNMPIISGTGLGSTRETIELCKQAAEAGSDYAMVLVSGYFAGALAGNTDALRSFWVDVSRSSPIPILIYNYPGASAGINLDSDLILDLAISCPNICGVKLSCGEIGKLTRIAAEVSNPRFISTYPRKFVNTGFCVLNGWTDSLLPSIFVNGHGAITLLANIAPYTVVKLFELAQAAQKDPALLPEAQRVQGIVAHAEHVVFKSGIAGTKSILDKWYGYGGAPRRPLQRLEQKDTKSLREHPRVEALMQLEHTLCGRSL